MKIIITGMLASAAVLLAPVAAAGPQSDVLCASNIAYRNLPAHYDECHDIAIGSHGGGGGGVFSGDDDGDHTENYRDNFPNDPGQK